MRGAPSHLSPSFKARPASDIPHFPGPHAPLLAADGETAEATCDQTGLSQEGCGSGESSSPLSFQALPRQEALAGDPEPRPLRVPGTASRL